MNFLSNKRGANNKAYYKYELYILTIQCTVCGPTWCPYCTLSIHVVHVHTIHISTKIQWEGQEHPWKVSNLSKSTTYPIYLGLKGSNPSHQPPGHIAIYRLAPERQAAFPLGVGQAGWRALPPTSLSLFHSHYSELLPLLSIISNLHY